MKLAILALLLLLVSSATSDACNRCRRFGSSCIYYRAPVVQYVPAAQIAQPNILVVQNSYPAPIAAQGNTVYSYQQASTQYSVSPAELFRQAADFSRASIQSSQLAVNGYNQLASTQLQLQSRLNEPLIRSAAAIQLLEAAGLSQSAPAQRSSISLRIYQESNGNWRVDQQQQSSDPNSPIQADGKSQQSSSPIQAPYFQKGQQTQLQSNSVISSRCLKCHSSTLTEPKGELVLDRAISPEIFREAIIRIKSNDPKVRMPPDGSLTPGEAGEVLNELLELSQPVAAQLPENDVVPPTPQINPNQ